MSITVKTISACISQFYDDMIARSETMKQHPNYKTGENYAYLGLPRTS